MQNRSTAVGSPDTSVGNKKMSMGFRFLLYGMIGFFVGGLCGFKLWVDNRHSAPTDQMSGMTMLGISLGAAVLGMVVAYVGLRRHLKLQATGVRVPAQVADVGALSVHGMCRYDIQFVFQGRTYQESHSGRKGEYAKGQQIEIALNPQKPKQFTIVTLEESAREFVEKEREKRALAGELPVAPASRSKRDRLIAGLMTQAAPQIVPIKQFFDGNADEGSIGCNLETHPGLEVFQSVLGGLLQRKDVEAVYAQIAETDPGEGCWPFSDTVFVVGAISQEELQELTSVLQPDEVGEMEVPDVITERHRSKVLGLWWD